ncbi:MAG TPA: bifunctional precorrin-2 dehydrogenase/sirohydrochlorin ferrochelatase [Dissulfurispiraceae bacterium]
MANYYPAFIDLKERLCVVVGGGKIAERKVLDLLACGARVRLISPSITKALAKQKEKGRIEHIERDYRKGDLKSAFLVIAATSNDLVNTRVSRDARSLVNVVDKPGLANFIVPSVVRKGLLAIAVSTSGASPAAARTIRKEIEERYGGEIGAFLGVLMKLRKKAMKDIPDKKAREAFLKGAASEEIFRVLRRAGLKKAEEAVAKKMQNAK